MLGPTGLGIIWRSVGVPPNCGLILSNQWGPPQNVNSVNGTISSNRTQGSTT